MRKGKQILVIILATLMVLNMGGTWLYDAGFSYAAGSETSKQYDANSENAGIDPASEETNTDTSSNNDKSVQTNNADADDSTVKNDTEAEASGNDAVEEPKLVQRDISAEVQEDVLYQTVNNKKKDSEALKRAGAFIKALTGGTADLSDDSGKDRKAPAEVIVSGELPEDVTAEVRYIEFAEPDKDDTTAESVLMAFDITLFDAQGNVYVPEGPLTVSIEGNSIKDAADNDEHILVYSYASNEERSKKLSRSGKDVYAADSLVYKEKGTDDEALLYEVYDRNKDYKDNEDAVRFAEDKEGLSKDKDSTISFEYSADWDKSAAFTDDGKKIEKEDETAAGIPAHFVLSVQKSPEELEKINEEQQKDVAEDKTEDKSDTKKEAGLSKTLTATDDKTYKATLTYNEEAGLPEDVKLEVRELKGLEYRKYRRLTKAALDADKFEFIRIFDIKIVDDNGTEYEPEAGVDVSIEILDEKDIPEKLHVVHFDEERSASLISSETDDSTVSFSTDSFSIYALMNEGTDVHYLTLQFLIWDDDAETYLPYVFKDDEGRDITQQIVKSGDKPTVPQPPANTDEKEFAGWYECIDIVHHEFKDDPYDFDNIVTDEDRPLDLYALYKDYASVIFHDQYDESSHSFPVLETRRGELKGDDDAKIAAVKISDISAAYRSSDDTEMKFAGWSETPVTTPGAETDDNGNPVSIVQPDDDGNWNITETRDLYPVYESMHWLNFYSAQAGLGAAYVSPVQILTLGTLGPLPVSSREGYTFMGWYTGSVHTEGSGDDAVEVVDYKKMVAKSNGTLNIIADTGDENVYFNQGRLCLRGDATLYAMWQANFKVMVWTQRTSDPIDQDESNNTYDYSETGIEQADIGDTVDVDLTDPDSALYKYSRKGGEGVYEDYVYGHTDGPKTIENKKAVTVLNVYYDLKEDYTPPTPGKTHKVIFTDSITGEEASDMPDPVEVTYGDSLQGHIPDTKPESKRRSESGKPIYDFSAWYLDEGCTVKADFASVIMPDHDLILYAGWEPKWYLVQIDTNYGSLYDNVGNNNLDGSGATWFWETYDGEPIGEYTHVKRDYEESGSGNYYFVKHDYEYYDGQPPDGADRKTYYSTDPQEATEDTTFEYSPGAYTYAGWYEVNDDGSEAAEPYDFSQHVDHNTKLKLHWKKNGVFYIAYSVGNGTQEDGSKTDIIDETTYSDEAEVILKRAAIAPAGYTFVGWKVRRSDSNAIYPAGKTFTLHADDAARIGGREIVYLDAVYEKVGTASIVYDANSGKLSGDNYDCGEIMTGPGTYTDLSGVPDTAEGTLTVSGLANNSKVRLSDGTGFTKEGAEFIGWSNKADYDPSDKDAEFYPVEDIQQNKIDYGVDTKEPSKLYAVWGYKVTYHLNSDAANWTSSGADWGEPYTKETVSGGEVVFTQTVFRNNTVSEPSSLSGSYVPNYTGSDGYMFRNWRTAQHAAGSATSDEDVYFNGQTPKLTGNLELWAYWDKAYEIGLHAVDSTNETIIDRTNDETGSPGWIATDTTGVKKKIVVGSSDEPVDLTDAATIEENYITEGCPPDGYVFAFAALHDPSESVDKISSDEKITAVRYNKTSKKTEVLYADSELYTEKPDGSEIYFVYYKRNTLDIGYKSMDMAGVLEDVTVTSDAPQDTGSAVSIYDMAAGVTGPLNYPAQGSGFTNYAFAIGDLTAGNASNLHLITSSSDTDTERPALKIRSTWRGFEYSTDDGTSWVSCGYRIKLYVVYFTQQPTVVMFGDKTQSPSDLLSTKFEYKLEVTQRTLVTNSEGQTVSDDTVPIYSTESAGNDRYKLSNGEAQSVILFYSSTTDPGSGQTTTVTQTAALEQISKDGFDTSNVSNYGIGSGYNWSYTTNGNKDEKPVVTYTNKYQPNKLEVYVALVEETTEGKTVIMRRDGRRSTDAQQYSFNMNVGDRAALLTRLPAENVAPDIEGYSFGTVIYGTSNGNNTEVTPAGFDVSSVSYKPVNEDDDSRCDFMLSDSEGSSLGALGDNKIFYVYYPKPQIRYVKADADGNITDIIGSEDGINPSTTHLMTYGKDPLTLNGTAVKQDQAIEVPAGGLTISQSGSSSFRMPPILDDMVEDDSVYHFYEKYLGYSRIGAGGASATNIRQLSGASDGLVMYLRMQDDGLEYSFDKSEGSWKQLSQADIPTVYAIYTERGYELQISKTIDLPEGDYDRSLYNDHDFTVTISSDAITRSSYPAEGAESENVPATPASGGDPGTIVLSVNDASRIKIKELGHGEYSIKETDKTKYNLSAKAGPIVGGSTSPVDVVNDTVELTLDTGKRLDLTNTPKPLCKIDTDDGTEHIFYTLKSAVKYVEDNMIGTADNPAQIEMLTDYVIPSSDVPVIASSDNITLTTALSQDEVPAGKHGYSGAGDGVAILTRSEALSDAPVITNRGNLIIEGVKIDGAEIEAETAMIHSSGDLTLKEGTVICNAVNNEGNGGAIYASTGNIKISGAVVRDNSASKGGAVYNAGNGTISIENSAAEVKNNKAVSGHGGAIYTVGGTIDILGGSIENNKAKEHGGAIYAESAVININITGTSHGLSNNKAGYSESGSADEGNGGAIYVVSGSVTIENGDLKNNTASNGSGGAVYTDSASIIVNGGTVSDNAAKSGGAFNTVSGEVVITGGTIKDNTASNGNGGAVSTTSGTVDISGGTLSGNTASDKGGSVYTDSGNVSVSGSNTKIEGGSAEEGGAVYSQSGNISVSDGTLTGNRATNGNGGAIYAGSGSVDLSGCKLGGDSALKGNTASGSGGAVYANTGNIKITNADLVYNAATGGSGGAVYAGSGAVSITDGSMDNNTSGANGGALYAESGNVTVSGCEYNNNTAATNGGALYAESSSVILKDSVSLTGNTATSGNGGAAYFGSGLIEMTGASMTGNTAANGSACFTESGKVYFYGGSYTGNISQENGGAVGIGSDEAKLHLQGDVKVKDNTIGEGGAKSNICLSQDSDAVINIEGLGSGANIGIYVPDSLTNKRDVPGARFATYTSDSNIGKISDDRNDFEVVKDEDSKKLYWGKPIKVIVKYQASFAGGFPPGATATTKKTLNTYYPISGDAAISVLAEDIFNKNDLGLTATATYAGAFGSSATSYDQYSTKLVWNSSEARWELEDHAGGRSALGTQDLIIYYAEPAYISIENNTDMPLDISTLTVGGRSVIDSSDTAGYGMVFAKNGAIRKQLLPVTTDDLKLAINSSINLLIPGGRNMAYTLDGDFSDVTAEVIRDGVRLRRTNVTEITLDVAADGSFNEFGGTTLNSSGTYEIKFGDDRYICKITDDHRFSKISDAVKYAKDNSLTTCEIEMLVDYLLPASDKVEIPQGYNITLSTANKAGDRYTYPDGERATISRDSENKDSMINSWNSAVGGTAGTLLTIKDLIFDGKSVRGNSDGGAVRTKYTNVVVDNTDFLNVYAGNGGALYVVFETGNNDKIPTKAGTTLEVRDSKFVGCNSTKATGSRLGGGAIHTNACDMTLSDCEFRDCFASDQAGAVFHRVDNVSGNPDSHASISDCQFIGCQAKAAGGLELDSKFIEVSDCLFENCVATVRNGGAFNIYVSNVNDPNFNCDARVSGCIFRDCHNTSTENNTARGFGGAFRSNTKTNIVENCTFVNTSSTKYGGAIGFSNVNSTTSSVLGCSFDTCEATRPTSNWGQGGAIYSKSLTTVIGDYVLPPGEVPDDITAGNYTVDEDGNYTRHTEIKNCTAYNQGGAVYIDRANNSSSLSITNAIINKNTSTNSTGGGIHSNVQTITLTDTEITNNTAKTQGGGIYNIVPQNANSVLTITGGRISYNTATNSGGGGIWYDSNNNNDVRGKMKIFVYGAELDHNTAGSSGGGIYTLAKEVTIGDHTYIDAEGTERTASSSITNCTSTTVGGGIYHSRCISGSFLHITNASVTDCEAKGGAGGGIWSNAWDVECDGCTISNNKASGEGGGIYNYDNNYKASMSLLIEGCTMSTNTSGGNGGAIYSVAKIVTLRDSNSGTHSLISDNTAATNGGGLSHSNADAGSITTITNATISGCTSSGKATGSGGNGGGGVYSVARTMTITGSEVSGNTAAYNGGGIHYNYASGSITVDNCDITGNTAGHFGGGVNTTGDMYFRNGSMVTGNKLSVSDIENAAGVYIPNNKQFIVGIKDLPIEQMDSSSIKDNLTASNEHSNLRIWSGTSENNSGAVSVLSSLDGEIYVVNAKKVGTWFGSADRVGFYGLSDEDGGYVFKADHSTLHGIIDRTDPDKLKIIWAGPPVCKITGKDENGNDILLYLRTTPEGDRGTDPAIFDKLDTGSTDYNTVSAFGLLRGTDLVLYKEDGTPYEGTEYSVKMLVEKFETSGRITINNITGRKISLTTAGKDDDDGFPYERDASRDRATVIRSSSIKENLSLIDAFNDFSLDNIIIDGGSKSGVTAGSGSRILYVDNGACTVKLGTRSILQNSHVTENGGAVKVVNGNFEINGGVINGCTASQNGGAVYKIGAGDLTFSGGSIMLCEAGGNGGGVYYSSGTFTMTDGTIDRCSADMGGGVYIAGNKTTNPFNMSKGSIIRNSARSNGGGIAVSGVNSRIYFSVQPEVTGNTCIKDDETVDCNLEMPNETLSMDNDYPSVINVKGASGLTSKANIGVYVPGSMEPEGGAYEDHGGEKDPFAKFSSECTNTKTFYCFVNDRNGLKGGLISNENPYNKIYWVKIFSLEIKKEIEASDSVPSSEYENEEFTFIVRLKGEAGVEGQPDAWDIDGEYGDMTFVSHGREAGFTEASVTLKPGETVKAENLSYDLEYEVFEQLTDEQKKTYAPLPSNNFNGYIGENNKLEVEEKERYVSRIKCVNLIPLCKLTDSSGSLLYMYYYDENGDPICDKEGNPYIIPAVFTELAGSGSAFDHLTDGTSGKPLFKANKDPYDPYDPANKGTQIQMTAPSYILTEPMSIPANLDVKLTTSGRNAPDFPFRGSGNAATVKRGQNSEGSFEGSMFIANGVLSLSNIVLDGNKNSYTSQGNGGIVKVPGGGLLRIQDGAVLQNSKTTGNGGAVFIDSNATVEMSGGTVNKNTCVGDGKGAGIYVDPDGKLKLSGNPSFGGSGIKAGSIQSNSKPGDYNCIDDGDKEGKNGGLRYTNPRQDIYLAGSGNPLQSLVITDNLRCSKGSIWVWAEDIEHHGQTLKQFGVFKENLIINDATLKAFRNAGYDDETLNETGAYLTGDIGDVIDGIRTMNWSGLKGSCKVVIRKVNKQYTPLQRTFTICRGDSTVPVEVGNEVLSNITSKSSGVIWIGKLPYGTYTVYEGSPDNPSATFTLVISEDGIAEKLIEKN